MTQPIDTSPPWWDGTVAIPFTVKEWNLILNNLVWEYSSTCSDTECDCNVAMNIVDRIEKNIGQE